MPQHFLAWYHLKNHLMCRCRMHSGITAYMQLTFPALSLTCSLFSTASAENKPPAVTHHLSAWLSATSAPAGPR